MKHNIIKILLVLIWMSIIFCFSNQVSSDSTRLSNTFIKNTICKANKKDCNNTINKTFKPVRKCAHFCVYLILGLLVFNCFKVNKKYIIFSLLICILYSISDEIHQMFVSGRSGELFDVFIDSFGSFIGILIIYRIKSKHLYINKIKE